MEQTKKAATRVIVVDRTSQGQEEFRRLVFGPGQKVVREKYFNWSYTAPDESVNVIVRYEIKEN